MDSMNEEISMEVFPYLRVYKDGSIERIAGTQVVPPGLDSETNVISKDILIIPQTSVTARLYRPNFTTKTTTQNYKLPLVVYFHGGAFCISSAFDPLYHTSLNNLVAESNVVALSVNYRLAPEHPLPLAYHDSWDALQWVVSHVMEDSEDHESWLKDSVDFHRVFFAGDSAGANIAHYMAIKFHAMDNGLSVIKDFKVIGLMMVNPYFWGKEPIGIEISDQFRKKMVDNWWGFVCPSDKGNDDPLINPFVEEAQGIEGVGCNKVLVTVTENDILRERGKLYHEKLVNSGWNGIAELYETEDEDHVFHIFNPTCDKAKNLIQRLATFINEH